MKIEMKHMDTNEVIGVELGKDNSRLARKIIQDQEVLGYRVVSIAEMMDALRFLDSLKIGEDVEDDESDYQPAYYQ